MRQRYGRIEDQKLSPDLARIQNFANGGGLEI